MHLAYLAFLIIVFVSGALRALPGLLALSCWQFSMSVAHGRANTTIGTVLLTTASKRRARAEVASSHGLVNKLRESLGSLAVAA